MTEVLNVIKDKGLTFEQKVIALAREAENSIDVLDIGAEIQQYRDQGVICDLFEGNAPYRPRYIVPDYEKFVSQGSQFLDLKPPTDLHELLNNLMILYRHVPSITTFPVYIGNLDRLMEPFIKDEKEAYGAIKRFLLYIDRTITDSFCHANIGPGMTKAGELILKAQRELETSTPNITLKYTNDLDESFAYDAIQTALITAKPSFANHEMFSSDFPDGYGVVSCYNGLPLGGGSYTLVRVNFGKVVEMFNSESDFFDRLLPDIMEKSAVYIRERIKFLVDESGFFESNFLAQEGLIDRSKFTAMFGMVGLANVVNTIMALRGSSERYGHSDEAADVGLKVIEQMEKELAKYPDAYCAITDQKYVLHAQVGIDTDTGIAPGCRIPIGEEPDVFEHMMHCGKFHKYFPSGIGDILTFDETYQKNPQSILSIIKGAFKNDVRYLSFYGTDADVIRITGYLVKKSEIEKLRKGEAVLRDTTVLGKGAVDNQKVLERKVRRDD